MSRIPGACEAVAIVTGHSKPANGEGLGILTLLVTAGCTSQPTPDVFMATPVAAVGTGQSVQLTAFVTNDESAVTWTATAGTVNSSGLYTAPSGTQSLAVKATTVKTPTHSATAIVNVGRSSRHDATSRSRLGLRWR
jgi:hypothetical protein